ncbi:3-alpha,7-alpha,12-alpha-trihydroxy-5-beta-cholest-24-enoyl-CoA hydratase [Hydrogenophaga sp. BPS33]|nr:3-alpha,7-alpha,12-alpha-trihydroxy-5-beta-cholest-24-enoyl-CoA hydratase [Hydrogenophaga sp. BPS33]
MDWKFEDIEHHYTSDFSMLYALSIGVGADPLDERQLRFVNDVEEGTPLAMPTLSTVIGFPGTWMRHPDTGIDVLKMVHGEEHIALHAPMPAAGRVIARHRVTRIVDKGEGRGATVTYEKLLFDAQTQAKLATVTHTTFCRGNGGFSAHDGLTDTPAAPPAKVPDGPPDQIFDVATLAQQALLYRLLADRNPLHSVPAVARAAGFEKPILHGLCTYGIAGYALVAAYGDYDPSRLKTLFTRFTAPVMPGETVRMEMYRQATGVAFRARVLERNTVVLDSGYAEFQ